MMHLLTGPSRCLYEVYSEVGAHTRRFASAEALIPLKLGHDPEGSGSATHLALWDTEVMPPPVVRRIELQGRHFPVGSWREAVEGCGLFWLHSGGLHQDTITASSLGWFTQRTAENKCTVIPDPGSVNWPMHVSVTRMLQRLIKRDLAVARAGEYPVMTEALRRHQSGARLILVNGLRQELRGLNSPGHG